MSVVCGAIKNGIAAIACDTQFSTGSLKIEAKHQKRPGKLYAVNDSVLGIVGWRAVSNVVEHMIREDAEAFKLDDPMTILSTLLNLHAKMKKLYFIETREDDCQPVESNHLDAMIINANGLFGISSYRSVSEIATFWSIGSGRELALGAMHALYDSSLSAEEIVNAGVSAAAAFDRSCALPLQTSSVALARAN